MNEALYSKNTFVCLGLAASVDNKQNTRKLNNIQNPFVSKLNLQNSNLMKSKSLIYNNIVVKRWCFCLYIYYFLPEQKSAVLHITERKERLCIKIELGRRDVTAIVIAHKCYPIWPPVLFFFSKHRVNFCASNMANIISRLLILHFK